MSVSELVYCSGILGMTFFPVSYPEQMRFTFTMLDSVQLQVISFSYSIYSVVIPDS